MKFGVPLPHWGLEHLVVDLRLQFTGFEEKLELIAKHVLPHFRPVAATV